MGLRSETEAVWIDDGVWDMNGVLVGWVDATDEVRENVEAFYLVYKEPVDSNKSWIYKLVGGFYKMLFKLRNSKEFAEKGFNVSPEPIPKPGIEGFPNGKTVDAVRKADSSPEKRVIIKEDLDGDAPYAESVWDRDSDSESIAKLKERNEDLRQRLQAEEGKTEELKQENEREKKDGRSNRHSDLYPDDEMYREGGF